MLQLRRLLDRSLFKSSEEEGFTLLELIIVVVVIGILAAIAIPIFSNQTRQAVISTVKSDVKSNSDMMTPGSNGRLYVTKEKFMEQAAATDQNVLDYFVNDSGVIACEQASRTFGEDDVVVYHFLTSVGYVEEGPCPEIGTDVPDPDDGEWTPPVDDPETPDPPTGNPVNDPMTQMAGLKFSTTYAPQTNSLNFCYTIKIEIDPAYPHATPNPTYTWEYKIDLSQPPFWGLNPNTNLNSVYGYTTKTYESNRWTMKGEGWNNEVTNSSPRTVGFCTSYVPEPPLNPQTYSYTIVPSSGNSNWWACVDFTVTSQLEYPTPWEITINLDNYFKSIDGKTPQFVNLNGTKVTGNTYKATGIGWNRYVALSMQRTYSTSICYYPNGSQW